MPAASPAMPPARNSAATTHERLVLTTLKDASSLHHLQRRTPFPLDKPLSAALIKKLIQTRLKEIEAGQAIMAPGKL